MSMKKIVARRVVRQFHRPTGPAGHVAGWVMGRRASNVQRNQWAAELLDIGPGDRIIELGCGPGIAVAAMARRATRGLVVGVDHSAVMVRQAGRRNARAVRAGTVRLVQAPIERMPAFHGPFDVALSVNSVGFWPDPPVQLLEVGGLLRPGGRIALVSQPRCPGATAATSAEAGRRLAALLSRAGFEDTKTETLGLDPPAVCVLATWPGQLPAG